MKLQTQLNIPEQESKISYKSKLLLLGSCFTENIGEKFAYFKFRHVQNPFGILFHPFAIENLIAKAVQQKEFTEKDIFQYNQNWHSFEAHSRLSHPNPEAILKALNGGITQTHKAIQESSHLIISIGTAFIYQHLESKKYVANCHKVPQKEFRKELISAQRICESLANIIVSCRTLNPDLQFIFTVSPVRHAKDGLVQNNRSKAQLISAIHEVIDQKEKAAYFPSYELLLDELRDYRFYTQDMLHPNATAIEYIWEKFTQTWLAKEASPTMKKIDVVQRNLQHKAFNPQSEAHQKFLQKLKEQKAELKTQFPFMDFS